MSKLNILSLTWNMSGEDTSRSAKAWKASTVGNHWSEWLRGRTRTNEALQHGTGTFDVVVLCLQEVHRKSEFAEFFLAELNRSLPKARKTPAQLEAQKFTMTVAKNKSLARLVGHSFDQHIYVFYRPSDGFSVAKRGSTCFGAGGSCVKGSVGIHLHRKNEHYLFVTSHFPFVSEGEEGDLARLAAYRNTKDKLIEELRTIGGTTVDSSKVTIVWAGDFNYRTDLIPWRFNEELPPNEKQGDRYKDRLDRLRSQGKEPWSVNAGWLECTEVKATTGNSNFKPNYQPTCRMVQLPQSANSAEITRVGQLRHEGMKKAYSPKRNPAWCDRVFIKPLDVENLTCKSNKFSTGSVESDHDAVFAELELKGVKIGEPVPQTLIEEWHDFTEELNQSNESESIGERVASIKWKSVLIQHAQLLIDRNWNIALNKGEKVSKGNEILAANAGKWKMVSASNTNEFQQMLNSYNREIQEAMLLIRQGEDGISYLNVLKRSAEIMGKTIPEFLAKGALRKRLDIEKELKRAFGDYDKAIKFHVIAVNNAIESLKLSKKQRETFRRQETFQRDEALKNAANVADLLNSHAGFLSEELVDEESSFQSDESVPIEAILSSTDWIKVLEQHSALIMQRSWAVAKRSEGTLLDKTTSLTANVAMWKLFRSSSTKELQNLVTNFNNTLREVSDALNEQNSDKFNEAKQTLNRNVSLLVAFLVKHKPLGSSATLADYRSAFTTYSRCLSHHAFVVDEVVRARTNALVTAALKDRDKAVAECKQIAFAVAKVMNGGKWPIRVSDEVEPILCIPPRESAIGHLSRETVAARVLHRKLHAMLDAMKPELKIRRNFLIVLQPLIIEVVDAIGAWMLALGDRLGQMTVVYAFAFGLLKSIDFLTIEMREKRENIGSYITWDPVQKDMAKLSFLLHKNYHL